MTRPMTALAAFVLTLFAALAISAPMAAAQDSEVNTSSIVEMQVGNPDAAVTVIEYASYTCPHCARFHESSFKELKKDYIDTGKINFIYREVYFDRFGLWASIVARCGEGAENRFFGITDMLYEQQSDWARQSDPNAIVERLRRIGKTAGLTDDQLDACLTDADRAQALYALWLERSEEDNIDSTPSFIIDGRKYNNMDYAEMAELIDNALGE